MFWLFPCFTDMTRDTQSQTESRQSEVTDVMALDSEGSWVEECWLSPLTIRFSKLHIQSFQIVPVIIIKEIDF